MAGTVSIAIYSNMAPAEAVERALDIVDAVGLTVEDDQLTDEKTVKKTATMSLPHVATAARYDLVSI